MGGIRKIQTRLTIIVLDEVVITNGDLTDDEIIGQLEEIYFDEQKLKKLLGKEEVSIDVCEFSIDDIIKDEKDE